MANPITILGNLIRAAENAGDAAAEEMRAYALEPETIAALSELRGGESLAQTRMWVAMVTLEEMPKHLARGIKAGRERAREMRTRVATGETIDHATRIERSAVPDADGAGFTIDPTALFEAAHAAPLTEALGFLMSERPERESSYTSRYASILNDVDFAVDVRPLRELARVIKAQKLPVTARVVKGHTVTRTEAVRTMQKYKRGFREAYAETTVTRPIGGWALVVEWTRATGTKGMLRFCNRGMATTVTAVSRLGMPANDREAAAE